MKQRVTAVIFSAVLLYLAGCGGNDVAPVAGQVSLDGKPLPDVYVVFEPLDGQPDDTSTGETDAEGRYTLHQLDGGEGALVGTHRVKLTTVKPDAMADERTPVPRDRIPPRYRGGSLTFDVPAGGTDSADFDLQSR